MYSEEETELRDLVMQNLDNAGFLNKIKAEIRAGVFLALEEEGNFKTKIPLFNRKYDDFINTTEGRLLISLIREFLDFYSLNFTLAVFDPEASTPSISRSELCDQLNLNSSDLDGPILLMLLKDILTRNSTSNATCGTNSSNITVKSPPNELASERVNIDELLNHDDSHQKEKSLSQDNVEHISTEKLESDSKSAANSSAALQIEDLDSSKVTDKTFNVLTEKDELPNKNSKYNNSKDTLSDLLSSDHDPFFDAPVPSEKSSFFTLHENPVEKSENKLNMEIHKNQDNAVKSSLSSLRDLPSLSASHEWTFSRDSKSTLPSLNALKSISNSETFNDEIENLDSKNNFEKKDSDTEESSEKQISEEIDESISENYEDLLNSNSFADDATTDQTVSQGSVVEGVDHVEPCK